MSVIARASARRSPATTDSARSSCLGFAGARFVMPERCLLPRRRIVHGRGRDAHSLLSAPRTEPYVRLSRIRLPPWVFDGEAVLRPWVKDTRRGEEAVQAGDQRAGNPGSVAAPFKGGDPELDDPVAEGRKRSAVGRHGVVVEEASDHACQPRPGLVEG